jgi:hypothetical protein
MPFSKLIVLIILSLVASYLFSRTVENSLKLRGLNPQRVSFFKYLSFGISFILLLLLGWLS